MRDGARQTSGRRASRSSHEAVLCTCFRRRDWTAPCCPESTRSCSRRSSTRCTLRGQDLVVTESTSSVLRVRTAVALAVLLATNAASFALLPDLHHEHHQRLGVSPRLERLLPTLMGVMALGLLATRNHRRSRALVGLSVASYYLWASSVAAGSGERAFAAYGLAWRAERVLSYCRSATPRGSFPGELVDLAPCCSRRVRRRGLPHPSAPMA